MTAVAALVPIHPASNAPSSSSSSKKGTRAASKEPKVVINNDGDVDSKNDIIKSPKDENPRPPSRGENPQRPPARPHSATRSKFDLEPNPFEQSFSRSSHHSNSSHSDRTTPPRGTDATAVKHNALPPLSSLTSPAAADPSQFPWLASQSLRTGPLSPAMLTGPQAANGNSTNGATARPAPAQEGAPNEGGFEPSTFRTGFTPGAGTGFTPGYSSLMAGNFASTLPMPSPNTAAFLNMVTNSTPIEGAENQNAQANGAPPADGGPPAHPPSAIPPHLQAHGLAHLQAQPGAGQETITPGTLSALTGVFNDMNRGAAGAPSSHPPQFYQHGSQPPGPPHIPHGVDFAQQNANAASQAANGLFLLSQAHQELSKREEEGRGQPLTGKKGGNVPATRAASGAGNKRKGGDTTTKAAPAKRGKKASPMNESSTSPNFNGDDSDDDMDRKDGNKFETEEEKRKNFLERNRQAALKCRQRKKAWLNELQAKVEQLQVENERLQQTIGGLHEEVGRLSSILMQHRDCGLAVQPAYGRPIR